MMTIGAYTVSPVAADWNVRECGRVSWVRVWTIAVLFFITSSVSPGGAENALPAPDSLLGSWGAFDKANGACATDGSGVDVTDTTMYVEIGGHGFRFSLAGSPKCEGAHCTLVTTSSGRGRVWTFTFKEADVATIKGWMPHDMAASRDKHILFEQQYKLGCP